MADFLLDCGVISAAGTMSTPTSISGMSIRFDHLTFSYFEDRKPVLPAFSGE